MFLLGLATTSAESLLIGVSSSGAPTAPVSRRDGPSCLRAEHRYRILGQVRLALLWMNVDDLGTARMAWRNDGAQTTVTLLAGSDPQRAPRHVNLWGFLREAENAEHATVIAMRNPASARLMFRTPSVGDRASLSAACSLITARESATALTSVSAAMLTYRSLDRALDAAASAPRWEHRLAARPSGSDVGFLSAMLRLMKAPAKESDRPVPYSTEYMYNGSIYQLTKREARVIGRTTVGTRTFDQLTRAQFAVRDADTQTATTFSVTYSDAEQIVLPVQIIYQPSFWLRIELRLDDSADPPNDQEDDESFVTRLRALCERLPR